VLKSVMILLLVSATVSACTPSIRIKVDNTCPGGFVHVWLSEAAEQELQSYDLTIETAVELNAVKEDVLDGNELYERNC